MSVQEDVLETIGPNGIEKNRLREKVGNIGQAELERTVNILMRAGRLRLAFGRYETVEPNGKQQAVSTQDRAPSAEEEAAANLKPPTRVCDRCGDEKELNKQNFSSNRHGFLKICKPCYVLALAAGREGKVISVSTPQTKESATPETTLTREGSQPPAGEPSRSRELRPATDGVYERAKARHALLLNRITVAKVDLANLEAEAGEIQRALEVLERVAGDGT